MDQNDVEREERAIHLFAIVALLPVVIVALVDRVRFDGGTTLCLTAVVLGAIGLTRTMRAVRRSHVPRARVRRARRRLSARRAVRKVLVSYRRARARNAARC
jgi:hypothetical protein